MNHPRGFFLIPIADDERLIVPIEPSIRAANQRSDPIGWVADDLVEALRITNSGLDRHSDRREFKACVEIHA